MGAARANCAQAAIYSAGLPPGAGEPVKRASISPRARAHIDTSHRSEPALRFNKLKDFNLLTHIYWNIAGVVYFPVTTLRAQPAWLQCPASAP